MGHDPASQRRDSDNEERPRRLLSDVLQMHVVINDCGFRCSRCISLRSGSFSLETAHIVDSATTCCKPRYVTLEIWIFKSLMQMQMQNLLVCSRQLPAVI